jgi:hypothetical protein
MVGLQVRMFSIMLGSAANVFERSPPESCRTMIAPGFRARMIIHRIKHCGGQYGAKAYADPRTQSVAVIPGDLDLPLSHPARCRPKEFLISQQVQRSFRIQEIPLKLAIA